MAYGTPPGGMPDPVGRALEALLGQISVLQARVESLEQERQESRLMPGVLDGETGDIVAVEPEPPVRRVC